MQVEGVVGAGHEAQSNGAAAGSPNSPATAASSATLLNGSNINTGKGDADAGTAPAAAAAAAAAATTAASASAPSAATAGGLGAEVEGNGADVFQALHKRVWIHFEPFGI